MKPTTRKRLLAWCLIVLPAVIIAAMVSAGNFYLPRRWLAENLSRQLDEAQGRELLDRIAQITSLEDAGWDSLIAALGHERDVVRRGALVSLLGELDRWRSMDPAEGTQRVIRLADLLDRHLRARSNETTAAHRELARRLVEWPIDRTVPGVARLWDVCQRALASSTVDGDDGELRESAVVVDGATDEMGEDELSQTRPNRTTSSFAITIGDDPSIPAAVETSVNTTLTDQDTDLGGAESVLPDDSQEPTTNVVDQTQRPSTELPPAAELMPAAPSVTVAPAPMMSGLPASMIPTAEDSEPRLLAEVPESVPVGSADEPSVGGPFTTDELVLGNLADRQLIDQLAASERAERDAARRELERRGYRPLDMELAIWLATADSAGKRQLIDTVIQLSGVDPHPWLMWLGEDSDPIVRKHAVTVMATSNDRRYYQYLVERWQKDDDAEVRRLIETIIDQWRP